VLDAVDRTIVDLLLEDGRMSMVELARRSNVSRTNVFTRFRRLQEEGVVRGFTALVDPASLGFGVAALITVTADQHGWKPLQDRLLELPGLEHLALTTGDADFVLRVRVEGVDDLRDVVLERLQAMEGVRSTTTVFVLEEHDVRRAPLDRPTTSHDH